MNHIFTTTLLLLSIYKVSAQQNHTLNLKNFGDGAPKPPVLKLYGIGNLNTETLNKLNSSGKIAVSIVPHYSKEKKRFWEIFLSFNKNATNNDSILASTVLFPEVGNHSFLATISRPYAINRDDKMAHFLSPFFEFSQKNIKVDTNSVQGKNTSGFFSTLSYTFGYSYIFNYKTADITASFSLSPYFSIINIPDEDNEDYRKLFKSPQLTSAIKCFGVKTAVQIKGVQIFADMRHTFDKKRTMPRELSGFNSNIGITFNADILEF